MRKQIVTALTVGALGLSGLGVSGAALAATPDTSTGSSTSTTTSAMDRIRAALSGLVTDRTLTQAQADKVATTLAAADIGKGGKGERGGRGGPGGPGGLAAAATTLKMTEADLRAALAAGKTLAAIAAEKNVPVNTLVDALVEAATTRIAQDVTDGRLTQAQADEITEDLRARITERVNSTRPARPADGPRDADGQAPAAPTPSTPSTPSTSPTTSS
jgi:hypothetical protein